jgi:DNA-binding XRE family transcriptional regulator
MLSKKISLKIARVLAGLTQKEAGNKFGVHYQTVANWELHPKIMKQKYVEMIPEIYFIDVDDIDFWRERE